MGEGRERLPFHGTVLLLTCSLAQNSLLLTRRNTREPPLAAMPECEVDGTMRIERL
jgi:hypothetical protein